MSKVHNSLPRSFREYSCFRGLKSIQSWCMKSLLSVKKKAKKVFNFDFILFVVVCGFFIWLTIDGLTAIFSSIQPPFQSQEQQYVVRYCTFNWPEQTDYAQLIDEHGNVWEIMDPPEYANGTMLGVLFDSQQTGEAADDVVIDLGEVK